jgi:hypothetical protein
LKLGQRFLGIRQDKILLRIQSGQSESADYFRSTPISRQSRSLLALRICAWMDMPRYSITSSARAMSFGGSVRRSIFAALRLRVENSTRTSSSSNVADGSKTEVAALERHVRSTLDNRYRQAAPACPFRAITGSQSIYRSLRRRILARQSISAS